MCVWYYALIRTQDVVFIYPLALRVGAADYYRCRGYGLVCAACERRSLFPLRLGRLHGARLRLCRGWVTVLRGMCRALEAEEEEARRFRAAPMRYGPIDRREWAAAAAAAASAAAASTA